MIKLVLGASLFLIAALPAVAQVKVDTAPQRFDAADTNKDGKVDSTEYDGFVEELVLLHDADHDDRLARGEVTNARDPAKFDRIDADKDGFLTAAEITTFSKSDFAVMDANQDGVIDRDEAARHK